MSNKVTEKVRNGTKATIVEDEKGWCGHELDFEKLASFGDVDVGVQCNTATGAKRCFIAITKCTAPLHSDGAVFYFEGESDLEVTLPKVVESLQRAYMLCKATDTMAAMRKEDEGTPWDS